MEQDERFERAARWIADAERVTVSTGAGMSRESGIPTFRDAMEGLWADYDPQLLATEAGFRANPERVWSWYAWRRRRVAQARPHAGYHALVEMEALVPELVVVTQNVDGLHAAAGSRDVVELHGSIVRAKCLDEEHPFTGTLDEGDDDEEVEPPPCPECGSPLRPDVVWFGEHLPADALLRAQRLARTSDVLLVVGTSGTVWPAAELPMLARRAGRRVVEVNAAPSDVTHAADVFLRGPAGEVLPALAARVRALRGA